MYVCFTCFILSTALKCNKITQSLRLTADLSSFQEQSEGEFDKNAHKVSDFNPDYKLRTACCCLVQKNQDYNLPNMQLIENDLFMKL